MISKAKVKYIKSLQVKKYRKQEQSFLVEGEKGVEELLNSTFEISLLCATESFIRRHEHILSKKQIEVIATSVEALSEVGSFQSNDGAVAIARMRPDVPLQVGANEYALVLDDIRDPGNLGTIIRTADWYGLTKVIASQETGDFYNPKTISATMGSFTRVAICYVSLVDFLQETKWPVYGTFMKGENVHQVAFEKQGLIVIGNESQGISSDVEALVTHRITIPSFGKAESLNAGTATGIVLDNLSRSLAVGD